jgi:hypothetical protein
MVEILIFIYHISIYIFIYKNFPRAALTSKVKVKVTLLPTVSRCHDRILITVRQLRVCLCWHPLRREDGSAVYSYCWPSPVQCFSSPNSPGLITIFYCPEFKTPPTWRAMFSYLFPPGTQKPSYAPRNWVRVIHLHVISASVLVKHFVRVDGVVVTGA